MKGSQIVVAGEPRGIFEEGIIDTADVYPGTVVELDPAAGIESGRPHIKAASATSAGPLFVARESELNGGNWQTGYSVGDRIFVYCPADGEDLNMRLTTTTTGTGTNVVMSIGDTLIVSTGGELAVGSTPATDPFLCMEDVTEGELAWCKYRGK